MDNSSDVDAIDSENCSLSSSLPTKMGNASDEPSSLTTSVSTLQPSSKQDEFYSSCEDETDESYSDTESEMREESLEKDASQSSGLKRFIGDCDQVTDILTEHDRTKNRKTYQVTKSGSRSGVIEKLEMSLTGVSEGIHIRLEESTPAEDYFCKSNDPVIESFMNDLIEQADKTDLRDFEVEDVDDEEDDAEAEGSFVRQKPVTRSQNKQSAAKRIDGTEVSSKKRLSATSKTSSDSMTSNISREQAGSAPVGMIAYDSDREMDDKSQLGNSFDSNRGSIQAVVQPEKRSSSVGDEKRAAEDDAAKVKELNNLNWSKAQETIELSKKNVEILRQNAASLQGNGKFVKRKISDDSKRHTDRLHPFHTHMLLYYGVYDTKQVLYAFQTLRNIIACDCRTFLCLSTTTSISNSPIKQQLVR